MMLQEKPGYNSMLQAKGYNSKWNTSTGESGGRPHKETTLMKFHIELGKVPTIDASLTVL
jgi:hypothetical protein